MGEKLHAAVILMYIFFAINKVKHLLNEVMMIGEKKSIERNFANVKEKLQRRENSANSTFIFKKS